MSTARVNTVLERERDDLPLYCPFSDPYYINVQSIWSSPKIVLENIKVTNLSMQLAPPFLRKIDNNGNVSELPK